MDISNGLIHQRIVQGVASFFPYGNLHLNRRRVSIEWRLPLIRLATEKSVEIIEALERRPSIVGAGNACLPTGYLVVLAEVRRTVPVLAQNLGKHGSALWNLT